MARQPPRRARRGREVVTPPRRRFPYGTASGSLPEHPYRDSALLHGGLALALVGIAWLTGGGIGRAVVVGLVYFTAATSWAWWRFRRRIQEARRASAEQAESKPDRSPENDARDP
jgi:hypothetical protein